jgi:hypothetical protein
MACPDRKGLVVSVSGLLYEYGANITHTDRQDIEQDVARISHRDQVEDLIKEGSRPGTRRMPSCGPLGAQDSQVREQDGDVRLKMRVPNT